MVEQIIVHGSANVFDDDGFLVPGVPDRPVPIKSVQPIALEEVNEDDRQGVKDALRVWAAAGEVVTPGDEVTVRGLRYRIVKTGWDWSAHRRPVLARHRPGVVFDCVRGDG